MSLSRHGIQSDRKDTIFGVHVSPDSAETLVRKGGITNHRLIAYSLSNISAKNYQNRLMCLEVIMCYISVVSETQCIIYFCAQFPYPVCISRPTEDYVFG